MPEVVRSIRIAVESKYKKKKRVSIVLIMLALLT